MALFTDGPISTTEDLAAYDAQVLDVAGTEGIDLSKKLNLAQDELAVELAALLPEPDRLDHVVITTPVRLWHVYLTLALVYRDAYNNQLNDRYGRRRDEYRGLAKWATTKLIETGVGLVWEPLPKAAPPQVTFVPGNQSVGTYYASVSWVNTRGDEGAASEWTAITVPDGNVLSVQPADQAAGATGWNVFVGLTPETLIQQNQGAIAVGQPWQQDTAVSSTGRSPGAGQMVDYVRPLPRILQRG